MKKILLLSLFVTLLLSIGNSASAAENFMDWNPGFYMNHKVGAPLDSEVCTGASSKHLKGIKTFYDWADLEGPAKGQYHFEEIDETLRKLNSGACAGQNKRMIFGVHFMTNQLQDDYTTCAPQYLHDGGEVARFTRSSRNRGRCLAKVYSPNTEAERSYKALLKAISERYNDEPRIEMIGVSGESAAGSCQGTHLKGDTYCFDQGDRFRLLTEYADVVRQYAPQKQTFFGFSLLCPDCEPHYENIVKPYVLNNPGVGFHWPDTFGEKAYVYDEGKSGPIFITQVACPFFAGKVNMVADSQIPETRNYHGGAQNFVNAVSLESDPWKGGHCPSHAVLQRRENFPSLNPPGSYSVEAKAAALASVDGKTYSMQCPSSMTNKGIECRTGRTEAEGGVIPTPQPIPTPTPEPQKTPCHHLTNTSIPGWAAPYDVFTGSLMMSAKCDASTVDLTVGSPNSGFAIYKDAYVWRSGKWNQMTLEGKAFNGSNAWIDAAAETTAYGLDTGDESYIAAYACKRVGDAWKCGCEDQSCAQPNWSLQKIQDPSRVRATTN